MFAVVYIFMSSREIPSTSGAFILLLLLLCFIFDVLIVGISKTQKLLDIFPGLQNQPVAARCVLAEAGDVDNGV